MGKTGDKSALWGHAPVRQRLLIYRTLIFTLIFNLELPKSLRSEHYTVYTQGFYVARYFYLAYNNAKTFIDVKKFPFS